MKNLKKVLALALAFAMVLSLCIGASAATQNVQDLADWDDVTNKDAVILLNAFKIMQGDSDGNFYPEEDVSRAEAAKMLSVALWGGQDDSATYAAFGNVGNYIDVDTTQWYIGYVNFMYSQRIMTGDKGYGAENNTFRPNRPNGTVSGVELLKMCLVALGYDETDEGLTGANWDMNTMALARLRGQKNLTEGTTVTDWTAPISRMNAAIVIANMIYRNTVTYDDGKIVYGGTFGTEILGMVEHTGILLANEYGTLGTDPAAPLINTEARDYADENAVVSWANLDVDGDASTTDGNIAAGTESIVMSSDLEDLGGMVKLYFVEGEIFSASVAPSTLTPEFSATGVVENADVVGNQLTYYVNGDTGLVGNIGAFNTTTKTFEPFSTTVSTHWLDTNGDGYIDTLSAYTVQGGIDEIKDVIETENLGTLYQIGTTPWNVRNDKADYVVNETQFIPADQCGFTAVKGDYVAWGSDENVFGENYYWGYVMKSVEGKVDRVYGDGSGVAIGGVKYAYADVVGTPFAPAIGTETTFYLYADGTLATAAAAAPTAPRSATYALIYDAGYEVVGSTTSMGGGTTLVVEVAAVLPDNTVKNYEVASIVYRGLNDGKDVTFSMNAASMVSDYTNAATSSLIQADGTLAANGVISVNAGTTSSPVEKKAPQPFAATSAEGEGVLYAVANKVADAEVFEYTINAQNGKMTLYVDASGNNHSDGMTTVTGKVVTAGNAKFGDTNKFLSADTVIYVKGSGNTESWSAVKGLELDGTVDAKYSVTNLYGTNDGVKVMVVTSRSASSPTGGFYYLLGAPDTTGRNSFVVDAFNATTNKVESLTLTSNTDDEKVAAGEPAALAKGDMFSGYTTSGGFNDFIGTGDAAGFITNIENGLIVVKSWDGTTEGVGTFTTTNNTLYVLVDGANSTTITAADLSEQVDTFGADHVGKYQTVVVESNTTAGVATHIIVFAELQEA